VTWTASQISRQNILYVAGERQMLKIHRRRRTRVAVLTAEQIHDRAALAPMLVTRLGLRAGNRGPLIALTSGISPQGKRICALTCPGWTAGATVWNCRILGDPMVGREFCVPGHAL
jgi:hypothetical protein